MGKRSGLRAIGSHAYEVSRQVWAIRMGDSMWCIFTGEPQSDTDCLQGLQDKGLDPFRTLQEARKWADS